MYAGGQVAADRAELLRSGQGTQATGHLLPQLDHPDLALGRVVIEGHPLVSGEPQVVVAAVKHPPGQRVVLLHQFAGASSGVVLGDRGGGAPQPGLPGQGGLVQMLQPTGLDRGFDQSFHLDQSVARLPGPAPPVRG
ncbi:hypothetical protein OG320_25335 [Microbispora sp. NBC_01189]|nr:hypothetical protein OG320_25335 [Microbispora sp. NBC_01189]